MKNFLVLIIDRGSKHLKKVENLLQKFNTNTCQYSKKEIKEKGTRHKKHKMDKTKRNITTTVKQND